MSELEDFIKKNKAKIDAITPRNPFLDKNDIQTNYDYLFSLPLEEFAKSLITSGEEEIWDENYDGDMECCGTTFYYMTSDKEHFDDFDEALDHEILWLKSEHHDCSNCVNHTDFDEVDNGCYMCCKGYEDNYERKI